jgi:hypothetical protein
MSFNSASTTARFFPDNNPAFGPFSGPPKRRLAPPERQRPQIDDVTFSGASDSHLQHMQCSIF